MDKDYIPTRLVGAAECEACNNNMPAFWYQTDMIGHSIYLPLSDTAVRNLQATYDIDPARAAEVLHANDNREEGLFTEISHAIPNRKLTELALCADCTTKQAFMAWVEELCQIMDIVHALEERILADKRIYDGRWRGLKANPKALIGLRFSDIPWPVHGSGNFTSPNQLTKSGVRRFLFSRCIYEKYAFMSGKHPKELLTAHRMRWDPKWFKKHLPWYCRTLPSFVEERAAILEGVNLIQRYLKQLEKDDWEVVLGDDPSRAQWERGVRYPLRGCVPDLEYYNSEKWALEGVAFDYVSLGVSAALGLALGLLS